LQAGVELTSLFDEDAERAAWTLFKKNSLLGFQMD